MKKIPLFLGICIITVIIAGCLSAPIQQAAPTTAHTPVPTIATAEPTPYHCYYNSETGKCQDHPVVTATVVTTMTRPTEYAEFSGWGDDVEAFHISKSGGYVVMGKNTGSSNFIVHIVDPNGYVVEYIFNEIGPYTGQKTTHLSEGNYYLEVDAEGAWAVIIAGL